MTSRRPMTRSFSGNGRTSSFSEEEGPSSNGRSESRNTYLSNVRPENRSTLCTVMAQLTEDIQPSFETTLKSKAVSENCNVKFTCVVTGYPAPELKWYKDDMEMDRYCGLPKYEIRRNGKTHTLHIYNCTLDDAAIYQVSASNSKGIVSCSGVLEVGTMNEYQIHQRFFAKLKEKAEKKKQDLAEQAKKEKEDKEQAKKDNSSRSPERTPRKRPIPEANPSAEVPGREAEAAAENYPKEETAPVPSVNAEVEQVSEQALAKKKIRISRSIDAESEISEAMNGTGAPNHSISSTASNHYDGGMSLAQFLAEALQPNAVDEKQASTKEEKGTKGTESAKEKDSNEEESKYKPDEEAEEQEKDRSGKEKNREEAAHPKRQHGKSVREHKDHHIQASFSSMLHSVKDFFFGKNKKDSHPHSEHRPDVSDTPPQTPPSFHVKPRSQDAALPTEVEQLQETTAEGSKVTGGGSAAEDEPMEATAEESLSGLLQLHAEAVGSEDELHSENKTENALDIPQHPAKEAESEPQMPQVWPPLPSSSGSGQDFSEGSVREDEMSVQVKPQMSESMPLRGHERVRVSGENNEISVHKEAACSSEVQEMSVAQGTSENGDPLMHPRHATFLLEADSAQSSQGGRAEGKRLELSKEEASECQNANVWGQKLQCQPAAKAGSNELKLSVKNTDEKQRETELPLETLPLIQISPVEDPTDVQQVPQICISFTEDVQDSQPLQNESLNAGIVHEMEPLPQFKICTTEDIPEIKSEIPVIHVEEEILTPTIEISKPEVQECPSLLNISISSQNLNVSEPSMEIHFEGAEDDIPGVEQPPRSDYSIPIINVSCTEEVNGELFSQSLSAEAVTLPLFEISPFAESGHLGEPETRADSAISYRKETTEASSLSDQIQTVAGTVGDQKDTIVAGILGDQRQTTLAGTMGDQKDTIVAGILEDQRDSREAGTPGDQRQTTVADTVIDQRDTTIAGTPGDQRQTTTQSTVGDQKDTTVAGILGDQRQTTVVGTPEDQMETAVVGTPEDQRITAVVGTPEDQRETAVVGTPEDQRITAVVGTPEDQRITAVVGTPEDQRETAVVSNPGETEPTTLQNSNKQSPEELAEQNAAENKSPLESENPKADVNVLTLSKTVEDSIESEITKSLKEARIESFMSVERLSFKPPLYPSLSPASLRKFMSKASADSDAAGDRQSDKAEDDLSGGSTPTSSLSCESSPRLKRRDSLSLIRSATPEELASGARRKIFIPKTKEDSEENKKESPYMSPGQARRTAFLQAPSGQNTPPMERRSPLLNRRKATLEVPKVVEEIPAPEPLSAKREEKSGDKRPDPLKAPQVIRKIRGEPFPDASGHLKLWCQFFNVLSDSTIKWYKDEEEILEVQRSGGDESQVALAIVLASSSDCGVYGCTIKNEYGSDTTDFLLSEDVMLEILLKDDLEVGEEIEMTPLTFSRGLADSGSWGGKFFGRVMTETVHLGQGWAHKSSRAKVIYGLDPVFESGSSCIMKVRNPIAYGTKLESNLAERNQEITKQECRVQNMIREYCKIFKAEATENENFGSALEVISQYLMYRPANSVPYATVEPDLPGHFQTHCWVDSKGKLKTNCASEVEQKCGCFQHWIHEWTHGNLLVTRLEGVDFKLTNVRVVTKSKGYQGLSECHSPEVFDQFVTHHQCNYYCGLLGLRPLKSTDSLQQPGKMKGSRSPMLNRKLSVGSGSPHVQKKGSVSPHAPRKAATSPKTPRKSQEAVDSNCGGKGRAEESR